MTTLGFGAEQLAAAGGNYERLEAPAMTTEGTSARRLRGIRGLGMGALIVFAFCGRCLAQVIDVTPEPGRLAKALREAKRGETVRLAPGFYEGSIRVPAGVSLEGAGAEVTTIVGSGGPAAVWYYTPPSPDDIGVRIVGLTVMGDTKTPRGVMARTIRIERCRFVGLSEGVDSVGPLSDIVCCDFIDCSTGVKAGNASPTIWGCEFIGGYAGVEAGEGEPYVRNNVFWNQTHGYAQRGAVPRKVCRPVVRNNLFFESKLSGLYMRFIDPPTPFVHRNIFNQCRVAVDGSRAVLDGLRYCMVDPNRWNRFVDGEQGEVVRVGRDGNIEGKVGASLVDGMLAYDFPKVAAVGPREGQPFTVVYGPEPEWTGFGTHGTGKLPPVRFDMAQPIVNSTLEEDLVARQQGLKILKRVRETSPGRSLDRLTCERDGEKSELVFDVSRIVEEEGKP